MRRMGMVRSRGMMRCNYDDMMIGIVVITGAANDNTSNNNTK
jgi:hypothetical protein